jgi:hypothetical protein
MSKRLENETHVEYKTRLKAEQAEEQNKIKGKTVHQSKVFGTKKNDTPNSGIKGVKE